MPDREHSDRSHALTSGYEAALRPTVRAPRNCDPLALNPAATGRPTVTFTSIPVLCSWHK
jgi:hypothetical protein